jgi:hypothetical protein
VYMAEQTAPVERKRPGQAWLARGLA